MDTAVISKTSRVGKRPIEIPKGVTLTVNGRTVEIKGPKGHLKRGLVDRVDVALENNRLLVSSTAPGRDGSRLQGLMRALIASMVKGVADGYEKILELRGTGYRVELKAGTLHFALGLSHPVAFAVPRRTAIACPTPRRAASTRTPRSSTMSSSATTTRSSIGALMP